MRQHSNISTDDSIDLDSSVVLEMGRVPSGSPQQSSTEHIEPNDIERQQPNVRCDTRHRELLRNHFPAD